ncbi:cytotoxic necrotizing factor [Vibrio agarivorans]|nr:cytotoxic necrotizing factor [Vibrio agarivorans]
MSYSGVDRALQGFADSSWNEDYLMMKHRPVFGDVFECVAEQVRMRLISDGDVRIKSNSEAQRDYFLSLSNSILTLFPVIDFMLPEIGIPLEIGFSTGQFGLSIDKAINGDHTAERLAGTRMSVTNSAILGATTLIPVLTQYGRELLDVTEPNLKTLPNQLVKSGGYPKEYLDHFTAKPKPIVHPRTHEKLIGVKIAEAGRGTLLRPLGFGQYLEIDAETGRALLGKQVIRTFDSSIQEFRWSEAKFRPGQVGSNEPNEQVLSQHLTQTRTDDSGFSERLDIILPDDLPIVSTSKPHSSGYEDMAGGRDAEVLRDFAEMEMLVDPYAYLTDVKALHEISINAQKEVMHHPFLMEYQPELTGRLVYRGDTRLPNELFHTGMNRKIAPVKEYQIDANNRGISGVVSTSTEQSIAVDYALGNRMGYVYAIELNHGGKSVNTMLRGADLHEVATLNIPPEDIMFAVGPFNPKAYYSYQVEDSARRSAELIINPHAVADSEVAEKAFNQIKATLKYQLDPRMTFAERYENRADLFWHEDETTMPDGTPLD